MARTAYECALAGEQVQIQVERIILDDSRLHVKRMSPELRFCSHIGTKNCPVLEAEPDKSDVKGFPYSGTGKCAYLLSLGHHD
jgi:hypothetical protein